MKPSPLTYHRPRSIDEACEILARVAHEGKVLAGGQSLIPLLSMRLAAPAHLVDIGSIPRLDSVSASSELGVTFDALTTHTALEADLSAARVQPLLGRALRWWRIRRSATAAPQWVRSSTPTLLRRCPPCWRC